MNSIVDGLLNELNNSKKPTASSGNMSRDEALRILNLKPEADETEINRAYQNLMKSLHPDKGGSEYLAQKLNAARDKLLKK